MRKTKLLNIDYMYVDAYESFLNMRENKVKYSLAIHLIAEEYNISERTLARVFKRLSGNVKSCHLMALGKYLPVPFFVFIRITFAISERKDRTYY